jgi:hypothetical protein
VPSQSLALSCLVSSRFALIHFVTVSFLISLLYDLFAGGRKAPPLREYTIMGETSQCLFGLR